MAESLAAARVALRAHSGDAAVAAAEAMALASRMRPFIDADWHAPGPAARVIDQETRIYNEGRAAIDKAQWERAIERYTRVVDMKASRADAALYWKAFAQDRQRLRADALATLAARSTPFSTPRLNRPSRCSRSCCMARPRHGLHARDPWREAGVVMHALT